MAKNDGSLDWNKIKQEYVTGHIGQRKLAEKYNVSEPVLARRCRKEEWVKAREEYRRRCYEKGLRKKENREADRLARMMDATSRAMDVAVEAFADENQFRRYIVSEAQVPGTYETVEKIFDKIDTKALKELVGVLKDLTALARDFYNIPTPAEEEARRIAAERLELDRKRAESGESDDNTLEIIGVPEEYKR